MIGRVRVCSCVIDVCSRRSVHIKKWREQHVKTVPHPSQWGRQEEFKLDKASVSDLNFSFNPAKYEGDLLSSTSSPWVWTMKGIDPAEISITVKQEVIQKIKSMDVSFISPESLKYELPKGGIPEVAFCGRSNVGKSTLVGALLRNSKLVRSSKRPGCTRTINYFGWIEPLRAVNANENKAIAYLVDLPGYGFSKASKSDAAQWTSTVENFIFNRHQSVLKRTFVLIDSRRGIASGDLRMLKILDSNAISYQIILTKADELAQSELNGTLRNVIRDVSRHAACYPVVHVVSAKYDLGLDDLLATICNVVGFSGARS